MPLVMAHIQCQGWLGLMRKALGLEGGEGAAEGATRMHSHAHISPTRTLERAYAGHPPLTAAGPDCSRQLADLRDTITES